jgi:hypothetical protein
MFYGGAWSVEPKILYKIRSNIADNLSEFQKAYKSNEFIRRFGKIQGEQSKKIPPEFNDIAKKEPLFYNKQFYFGTKLPPELILKEELMDVLFEHYLASRQLNSFLQLAYM